MLKLFAKLLMGIYSLILKNVLFHSHLLIFCLVACSFDVCVSTLFTLNAYPVIWHKINTLQLVKHFDSN